jgi:hypothetical protein
MKIYILILAFFTSYKVMAQQDTLELITDDDVVTKQMVRLKYFNSTRTINTHSVEFLPKGYLDLRILHRFGAVKNGFKDLFGLDFASMRMGLDYGLSNKVTVGIGRTTLRKELDAFAKFKLLGSSKNLPIEAFTIIGASRTTGTAFDDLGNEIKDKNAFFAQIGIATLIKNRVALQITPTYVNQGLIEDVKNKNNIFSVGIDTRFKLKHNLSFVAEYFANVSGLNNDVYKNPLSIGFDFETGGHVFQLHFSNTSGMAERAFITRTTSTWGKGEIRFGFNLSRLFQVKK